MGVPKDLPPGVNKVGYAVLTMVAKDTMPEWADEDFFTV
jgi:uptake hydrogenase small subunit